MTEDTTNTAPPATRRRYPAAERRARMMADAAVHFAEHGFESSIRDLEASLGVTQALIYRHFKSKDDLIEQTLDHIFAGNIGLNLSLDMDAPLEPQLTRAYQSLLTGMDAVKTRLFLRAGLAGRSWPGRRRNAMTGGFLIELVGMLRAEAGLPDTAEMSVTMGEREIIFTLHSSIVYLAIRRHVFQGYLPDDLEATIALYVRSFLAGAVMSLQDLHRSADPSLMAPLSTEAP